MSGSTSAGRTLRSKKSETGLFGNSNSVSSRFDQSVPPVPQTSAAEPKAKRKLTLFGKRRKSGSAISSSSSPTSRPSCDSSEMVRKSGEAARASFKAVHDFVNGPSAIDHYVSCSQPLPSRLPPLDVSPPSLGFYNGGISPKASPSRINAILEHQTQSRDGRTRTPVKTQPRPVITVSAPAIKENTEVGANVFASPRSAPVPPRPARSAERDTHKTPPTPAHRMPTTPLRFPIPPAEDVNSTGNTLRRPEFNSDFSFPSKNEAGSSTRDRANRGASVDILSNRTTDKQTTRNKIVSSPSRIKLQSESRPSLPSSCNEDNQSLRPPPMPLPAPPSTFSIDSQDQLEPMTSSNSMPTIPSLPSNNSLVSLQSRSERLAFRPRTPISASDMGEEEKQQEQMRQARFEHAQKQSVSDLREQHLLRVEMNAQRVRFDELVSKVGKIDEKAQSERAEMRKRIDVLEEEGREMEQEIKRLKTAAGDGVRACCGCGGKAGFLETPGSTMDGIDDFLTTPTDIGSPASPFEYARRLLSNTPKEKTLRRSNTMPDGFDDESGGGVRPATSGRKGNRGSSTWIMATAGLLPKFGGGIHGTKAPNGNEKGLGLLPDSPIISEELRSSVSEGRISNSVPELSTGTTGVNSKDATLSISERARGIRGRGLEKNKAPNMEEILARLRSFESHSPQTMFR